jgi:hypothetical protein
MANLIEQPNKFRILPDSLVIEVFRNEDEPFRFNITASSIEMNIYEDLMVPYLTGTIAVVDSASILSLNLMGNEKLRVRLWNNEDYIVEKEFVIWNITNVERLNETTASFVIHFMEPHGFLNNFINVSRAFSGNHSEIMQSVMKDYLLIDVNDIELSFDNSKIVFPNVRPLQAINMVLKNTTTEYGEPFFFYSSIKEGLHIRSLYSLYQNNDAEPLIFSKTPTIKNEFNAAALHIMRHTPIEDTSLIDIARKKVLRSNHLVIDPFRNNVFGGDYYYRDHFNQKRQANRELEEGLQFDPTFPLDSSGRNVETISSENSDVPFIATISTSGLFDGLPAITEDQTFTDRRLSINAEADMLFLDKDSAEIIVPGWHMLSTEKNTSIGRVISINIPKTDPIMVGSSIQDVIDRKYSGKFLIANVCHKFTFNDENNREIYIATLRLKRTSSLDDSSITGEIQQGLL